MNTIAYIIIIATAYWYLRLLYNRYITAKYSFKLYRVRDKLRMLAAEGKIDPNEKIFDYMDQTISKTVKYLPFINIFIIKWRTKNVKEQVRENVEKINARISTNEHYVEIRKEFHG